MLDHVIPLLQCPHCALPLARISGDDGSAAPGPLGCVSGHRFDEARQGYVSLLPARRDRTRGDSAAMVMSRQRVLASGLYSAVREGVADAARWACEQTAGVIVDAGCGPGIYLADAAEASGRVGLGMDLSVPAAKRAARAHPRCGAIVADTHAPWPVRDAVAAVVLDVFAPRNGAEMHRVIRPGGHLVVATPTATHLHELVEAGVLISVDPQKQDRLDAQLDPWFTLARTVSVRWAMRPDLTQQADLVHMGPSHHHVSAARGGQDRETRATARCASSPNRDATAGAAAPVVPDVGRDTVTGSVRISLYARRD